MRIQVKTTRDFSGLVISQFMEIGFQLVAYNFKDDFDSLYFDLLPNAESIEIWNKEHDNHTILEHLTELSQATDKRFTINLVNTRDTLPIMAQLKKDFEEMFLEASIVNGAVYTKTSNVVIEMKLFNKLDKPLKILFPYKSLFGLKIKDVSLQDMIFLKTESVSPDNQIILQENEVHRETLTYQLEFNSSKFTYFVLETLATSFNEKERNFKLPPIPITFH